MTDTTEAPKPLNDEEIADVSKRIATTLLEAGRTRADSYIPKGEKRIAFWQYVEREIRAIIRERDRLALETDTQRVKDIARLTTERDEAREQLAERDRKLADAQYTICGFIRAPGFAVKPYVVDEALRTFEARQK